MVRLLDLDHRTAGGGQLAQFGIHDVAEIEHHCLVVGVVLVPQHARQCRRADRAEIHRAIAEALRDLPQRGVFEAAGQLLINDRRLVGLLHLPQDLAGPDVVPRHPALRGAAVALDAAQPLDRIEEPRLAADREIEAAVAVGDDVEPGGLLRIDDRRDGVEILLAEQGVAERRLDDGPPRLASYHSGPGQDPVIAVGSIMSRVVFSIAGCPSARHTRESGYPGRARILGPLFEPGASSGLPLARERR